MNLDSKATGITPTPAQWADACSRLLKAEIARAGFTYKQLALRLDKMGVAETEASIRNKLSRGTFSAAFFAQCIRAMGGGVVDFASVLPLDAPSEKDNARSRTVRPTERKATSRE